MTTYEVGAWFIVEAASEQEARDKVVEGVVGGRPKLGSIEDWDVDGIEEVQVEDGVVEQLEPRVIDVGKMTQEAWLRHDELDPGDHVDSDRPPGTSGSWGEA